MKNYALELGMPESAILIDCISNNSNETFQNFTKFIPIHENDNLILITSAYHLKRCLTSAQKYVDKDLIYTLVSAETKYFEQKNYRNTTLGQEL